MNDSDDPTDDRAQRIATSIRERLENREGQDDRRGFLKKSTLAGGALVALAGGTGLSLADQHGDSTDPSGGMNQTEMQEAFDDVSGTDVDVLQYALSLERLEDAFYQQAAEQFSEGDFMESDALSDFSEETRTQAWEYLQAIGDHESQHVEVLSQAVELLGGDPTPPGEGGLGNNTTTTTSGNETGSGNGTTTSNGTDNGTANNGTTTSNGTDTTVGSGSQSYDFGVESVDDFLQVGAQLENVGVAAYAGAAPYIESPDLLATALSIHSVEARHAAFLNYLIGESPFPHAFDPVMTQQEVLEAIEPFIGGGGGSGTTTETTTETETETATETTTQNGTTTTSGNGTTTTTSGNATTTTSGNETTTDSS